MLWNDILIDRNINNDQVVAALSLVFSVSSVDILLVDDIAEAEVSNHIRLLCERIPVQGDFLMKLSIYIRDSMLEQFEPQSTIKQFCGVLHCKCLISDSSINPFSMLLIQELQDIQLIALDPERLGENEQYIIITPTLKLR